MDKVKIKSNHHVRHRSAKSLSNQPVIPVQLLFKALQGHKNNIYKLFRIFSACVLIILTILVLVGKNKTTAEILLDEFAAALRSGKGFEYSSDPNSDYVFVKNTPIYNAFAGDKKTIGGHRLMLVRGDNGLEIRFKSADISQTKVSQQARIDTGASESSESAILNNPAQAALDQINLQLEEISTGLRDVSEKISDIRKNVSEITSRAKMEALNGERIVVFQDIVYGTDLDYRLGEEGIKQELIIKDPQTLNNEFNFVLSFPGMEYRDVGLGVWYFKGKNGDVMRISKAYAIDTDGKFTNDVSVSLKTTLLVNILTVKIPQDWLTDKERKFPVKVATAFEIVPELRVSSNQPTESVAGISSEITPKATELHPTTEATVNSTLAPVEEPAITITQQP